jgi:hypothetical protein
MLKIGIKGTVMIPNLFIAPLPIAVCRDKRPLTDLCAPFVSKKPTVVRDGAATLKGSHLSPDFSKNLRASLLNDDLSNEPYFGQIHLTGQYL